MISFLLLPLSPVSSNLGTSSPSNKGSPNLNAWSIPQTAWWVWKRFSVVSWTQCDEMIDNRAAFKASFVDLWDLSRFLIISEFHVLIFVQLVTDLVKYLRLAVGKCVSNKILNKLYCQFNFVMKMATTNGQNI